MERPMLPLGEYVQLLEKNGLLSKPSQPVAGMDRQITNVVYDSRKAQPGSLFLCKGAAFRQTYLDQALRQGAAAYVSEEVYPVPVPCIQVTDIRRAIGLLADRAWGHPSHSLEVIGLTGTKGKTTTAYFLKAILDAWREEQGLHRVGLLSTVVTDDGLFRRPATLTTPEPLELQEHLWNAVNAGCGQVVMECSSQALKYGRMIGVELNTAVFLNIGEDHISPQEHPTVEDYFQSKLKIFAQAEQAVVNLDSQRAGEILAAAGRCKRVLTYSMVDSTADLCPRELVHRREGLAFSVCYGGQEESFSIPMAGQFNVSNALAALAVAQLLAVPARCVRSGLAAVRVPGRMETYERGGKTVIVDYAHNGMALSTLLQAVKQDWPAQRVTVVFGCTGGKGLDRRAGMGQAAGAYADCIFLTEDDPAQEPVEAICEEIGRSIAPSGKKWTVITDRAEAIRQAIETAPNPSVIVLAGKGSEIQQKRAGGAEPYAGDGLLARKYLGLPMEG